MWRQKIAICFAVGLATACSARTQELTLAADDDADAQIDAGPACPHDPTLDSDVLAACGASSPAARIGAADQCLSNAGCPGRQVCVCGGLDPLGGGQPNACANRDCQVDQDCGPAASCQNSVDVVGVVGSFMPLQMQSSRHCTTCADECATSLDCPGSDLTNPSAPTCRFDQNKGHWACGSPSIISG
jgi:hypothetical protein